MSHLDNVVYAIETKLADDTVLFLKGEKNVAKNEKLRRVIVWRSNGTLSKSDGPARQRVTSGTEITPIIFRRDEVFNVRILAENEDSLDYLIDAVASAIFRHFGPNALMGDVEYRWLNDDSKGGQHTARQPGVEFQLRVRLRSLSQPTGYAILEQAEGTLEMGDESVVVTTPEVL